ncbi:MAG: type II secretion system F family protein [Paracoccaceae bacterium]
MAVWRATGFTATGQPVRRMIEARDRDEAVRRLAGLGIAVHRLAEDRQGTAAPALKADDRARLYGELGALLEARIPLVDALGTVEATANGPRLSNAAKRLREAVASGARFSAAIGAAGAGEAERGAIAANEARGALGAGLVRLGQNLTRRAALRGALIGALVYPAILLAVTLLSLAVILLGVVPNLAPLFRSAGDAAPASAQALLAASEFLTLHGETLAAGVAVLAIAGALALRLPPVRRTAERVFVATPLLGPLVQSDDAAGLLRLLASLVAADTPVPDAFSLAARAAQLARLQGALGRIAEALRTGAELPAAVAAEPAVAPGVSALVAVGARTGRLAEMLDAAAEALERQTEARIARLMALLPPVMTVLLGAIVGGFSAIVMSAILSANDFAF